MSRNVPAAQLRLLTSASTGNVSLYQKILLKVAEDFTLDKNSGHKGATLSGMNSSRKTSPSNVIKFVINK